MRGSTSRLCVLVIALIAAISAVHGAPSSSSPFSAIASSRMIKRNNTLSALNAPSQGKEPEYRTTGYGGVVATETDVCSNVGANLLNAGGSAADAIIGASLCVGSIDAFHSGIAGGGFIVVRDEKKTHEGYDGVKVIDMRESAPAASNETMYSNNTNPEASTIGGLAVGVPGELRGYELLHKQYGRLSWEQIVAPAVKLNREGFKVTSQLSIVIAQYKDGFICNDTYFKEVYCANGTAVGLGDHIKRERLARTLETIGKHGADAFYTGAMANRTIAAIQSAGGIMTLEDLREYKAIEREPFSIDFPGQKRVYSSGAPSSGVVVLSALKTIGTYGLHGLHNDGVNLTTHRLIEATKWAYAERTSYGDPSFVKNVSKLEKTALSDRAVAEKRSKITDNSTHPVAYYDPQKLDVLTDHGTSQLSVIDANGLAVTLTTTVNLLFGAQLMTEDGFVLNDEQDDFSSPGAANAFGFAPSEANFIVPHKRPLSSISPVIIVDKQTGKTTHALGCAGGSRIITANIQNTFNALLGVELQKSIRMPRWHNQLIPNTTVLEWEASSNPTIPNWQGFSNATGAFLADCGHNVTYIGPGQSTAQGVSYQEDEGVFHGASDPRQLAALSAAI